MSTALDIRAADPEVGTIEIASIERDPELQVRAKGTNRVTVADYAAAMASGATFPPIVVYRSKKNGPLFLCDGAHRIEAALKNGATTIAAEVRDGSRRDALLAALASAKTFGLRFSNADKRRAVTLLLNDAALKKRSDNHLAELAGVSQPFVSKLRQQLITVIKPEPSHDAPEALPEAKPAPDPEAKLTQLTNKFRRILSEVPREQLQRFSDLVLEALGAGEVGTAPDARSVIE